MEDKDPAAELRIVLAHVVMGCIGLTGLVLLTRWRVEVMMRKGKHAATCTQHEDAVVHRTRETEGSGLQRRCSAVGYTGSHSGDAFQNASHPAQFTLPHGAGLEGLCSSPGCVEGRISSPGTSGKRRQGGTSTTDHTRLQTAGSRDLHAGEGLPADLLEVRCCGCLTDDTEANGVRNA